MPNSTERRESGVCFCQAVTGRFTGEPLWICYDHDDDCRRAVGAALNVWVGYPPGNAEIQGASLRTYSKTGRVERGFCGTCGTSISYADRLLPDQLYVALGFLNHPERFPPRAHAYWPIKPSWMELSDSLPRYPDNTRERNSELSNQSLTPTDCTEPPAEIQPEVPKVGSADSPGG